MRLKTNLSSHFLMFVFLLVFVFFVSYFLPFFSNSVESACWVIGYDEAPCSFQNSSATWEPNPCNQCHFCTGTSCAGPVTCSQYKYIYGVPEYRCEFVTDTHDVPSCESYKTDVAEPSCSTGGYSPQCGNGTTELGEACDDGNNANGDGCNQFCAIEGTGGGGGNGGGGGYNVDTSILPLIRYVDNGQTTTYSIILNVTNVAQPVNVSLSVTNCPTGATCSFVGGNTTTFTSDGGSTHTLNVTANSVLPGPYSIGIRSDFDSNGVTGYDQVVSDLVVNPSVGSGDPTVNIDTPTNGATVSGNVYIGGWAIDNANASESAISSFKIYVDGNFIANGQSYARPDVCIFFAGGRPGCPNVGYEYIWNSNSVPNGFHILRFEATDSDTPPKTSYIEKTYNVSNGGLARIQGFKKNSVNDSHTDVPPATETVFLNGAGGQVVNPYTFNGITAGANNTVSVSIPSGWSVGYTLCYGTTTCHANPVTPGSSVIINVPNTLPPADQYADLWWHFTPPAPPQFTVTVTVNQTIGGRVTSADALINCGLDCSETYNQGTVVTLSAIPNSAQWRFVGWSGDCAGSGVGNCILTVNSAKSVGARFVPVPFQYKEF